MIDRNAHILAGMPADDPHRCLFQDHEWSDWSAWRAYMPGPLISPVARSDEPVKVKILKHRERICAQCKAVESMDDEKTTLIEDPHHIEARLGRKVAR